MKVTVGDIEVAYTEQGHGQPVVFVHGLAEDHLSWAAQQRDLSGVRTLAYDLRGHSGTSLGDGEGTLLQLGQDLIWFLERTCGSAICVGFSLGGTVVLQAAVARPDLVSAAVVLGTSSVVGRTAAEFYGQRIELARTGARSDFAAALRDDTAAAIVDPDIDIEAVTESRLTAVGDGTGYANAAAAMARLNEEPLTPLLADVHCHVDVVGGEKDTFCPRKAADILVDAVPRATYHEIPRVGHLMNVDDPQAVTATLQAIIEGREH